MKMVDYGYSIITKPENKAWLRVSLLCDTNIIKNIKSNYYSVYYNGKEITWKSGVKAVLIESKVIQDINNHKERKNEIT